MNVLILISYEKSDKSIVLRDIYVRKKGVLGCDKVGINCDFEKPEILRYVNINVKIPPGR